MNGFLRLIPDLLIKTLNLRRAVCNKSGTVHTYWLQTTSPQSELALQDAGWFWIQRRSVPLGNAETQEVCRAVRYDICVKEGWNNNKENPIFCCLPFEQHFVISLHLILIFMPVVECVLLLYKGPVTDPRSPNEAHHSNTGLLTPAPVFVPWWLHWKDEVNSTRPGRCREECTCQKVLLTQDWE